MGTNPGAVALDFISTTSRCTTIPSTTRHHTKCKTRRHEAECKSASPLVKTNTARHHTKDKPTQTNQESCTSTSPHEVHTEQGGLSMAANCQERLASSILAERILFGTALFNCNNNGAVGATMLHTRHAGLQAHVRGNAWKPPRPGIEPGSSAWQAEILTTILPRNWNSSIYQLAHNLMARNTGFGFWFWILFWFGFGIWILFGSYIFYVDYDLIYVDKD